MKRNLPSKVAGAERGEVKHHQVTYVCYKAKFSKVENRAWQRLSHRLVAGVRQTCWCGSKLRCKVCTKFQSNIQTRHNYSDKWVTGETLCALATFRTTRKPTNINTLCCFRREHKLLLRRNVHLLMLPMWATSCMTFQKMLLLSFESS
jgi:hypothetical protein